jgi:hypothetical protein
LSYGELCILVACLSLASCSDLFLLSSVISNSYLTQASLRYWARCLRLCFSLFLLSLICLWLSLSPSYSRALGDMLDSDSSMDLTSSAFGGIRGGHRIMNTSRACVASASMTAPLELLMISAEVPMS